MKRIICLLAVGALVAAPLAHSLFAAPKVKVALCHVPEEGDDDFDDGPHVIVVSENAVDSHLAHGDCVIEVLGSARAGWSCDPTDATDPVGVCDNPNPQPPADDDDD